VVDRSRGRLSRHPRIETAYGMKGETRGRGGRKRAQSHDNDMMEKKIKALLVNWESVIAT